MSLLHLMLALATLTLTTATCLNTFKQHCLAFEPSSFLPNATLNHLEYVTNGTTLLFPDNVASCNRPSQQVQTNLCRVALQIPTSDRSRITFELWLPEKWPGTRIIATGNGGIDGCIKYEDLAYTTSHGFAAVGTNNGHNGTTGIEFLNNDDILEDFAHRALHVGTTSAKLLTKHFYNKPPSHSYFIGCSLGGRMGIHAADVHPHDYDGILAGCPAVDFNNLQGERAMFYPITGPVGSPDFITPDLWTGLIHGEVLKQCDGLDGVLDGIIEVPERCFFEPGKLLCEGGEVGGCLNERQVAQLRDIYAPYTYPNGTLIFPRMNPGNEIEAVKKFFAGAPFSYSEEWFRYVVLKDPTFDALTYTTRLVALAASLNPFNIETYPRTLPTFQSLHSKILTYHGGQDNQITSFNTDRFYDYMSAASSTSELQDWFRFFRVSGMFHCSSGPGAWVLGQGGGAAAKGIAFEPEGNVLAALVEWVEKGRAPEVMRGTKFVGDNVSMGVDFQRDHCLYPSTQTYIGGDHKLPSSWKCV